MLCILLSGCAVGVANLALETKYHHILNSCFETKKPAFLYEARCADLDGTVILGSSTFCTGIQGFNPLPYKSKNHEYIYKYPKSWQDYLSSKDKWDQLLFHKLLLEKQRTMIAPLQEGTRLEITGLYDYPRGESGRVLVVTAKIKTGIHQGTIIELPSNSGFSDIGPDWAKRLFNVPNKDIIFSTEYLMKCEDKV